MHDRRPAKSTRRDTGGETEAESDDVDDRPPATATASAFNVLTEKGSVLLYDFNTSNGVTEGSSLSRRLCTITYRLLDSKSRYFSPAAFGVTIIN